MPATVYTGGPIYPEADGRAVEALAVRGGRVLHAGTLTDAQAAAGPHAARRDLNGGTLLPGLTDAHVHVWKVGQLRTTVLDLRGVTALDDLARAVQRRHAELPPGAWLWGRGWNETRLGGTPDRALLDTLAPGRPVLLTRTCAHIHAVNTAALNAAGLQPDTPAPPGGTIDFSRGRLTETAYGLIVRAMPAPSAAQYEAWILAGLTCLQALGFTAVTDPAVDAPLYAAYRALDAAGRLPLRVNLLYIRRPDGGADTLPLPEKHHSSRLRCDSVKFFGDGGLSGATAAISVPYRNVEPPSQGVLRFGTDDLYALAREAHVAGFRIGAHAIGDVALDQLLAVYARLDREHPGGPRHRIEHFGLPSAAHLELARALRVIAVPQPVFLRELRANYDRFVPPALAGQVFPLRAYFDAGLDVAFSSDGPVVQDLRPLAGVQAALAEPYVPGTAVSTAQALGAYTHGGAVAHGDEHERGRLRPGFLADFTLLGQDPFHTAPQHLPDIPVRSVHVAEDPPHDHPAQ
ncbi:amidohydrolase (plasmid) [Deinococcus taeanensis]|uniref:amidohydrolase n=1 Tax=Deinococcus taeanensis TaxID=2737050 RepID=UPI001CDD6ECF|nr:amidohydrolase [Deinococcus taeanensis]UBV44655.1 amidohydrolase [Deinococcus taeanensis]